ncbi:MULTISPECIES: HypC/HybG/HupF family hydrogenase formation chaperone [unclassified Thioalkalivibrio]|uniref:HypC/HybG/HupF family hydrogenase formation chaperone n=1 Tax=unclassified Thioalkalivibrio TaxID=2621013 RepID=UPI00036FD558|nr:MULTISPECIES: HypC/HybG/HupF family hydrogenase formation chaperone [unclassified Thioalkalivibrio]
MCLAIPGRIDSVEGDDPLFRQARVAFGGVTRTVSLACTPEAGPGDYVLVHAGIAIATIDEAAAERTLAALREIPEHEPPAPEGP